jgi:hypothetical protein
LIHDIVLNNGKSYKRTKLLYGFISPYPGTQRRWLEGECKRGGASLRGEGYPIKT